MPESFPMTRERFDQLRREVERLETEEMPKVAEKIADARAEGDLKENAEYHAQRENQGLLQAKINDLKYKLANAFIIDPSKIDTSTVGLLATVTVKDLDMEIEEEFTLVGVGDEDFDAGKIQSASPVGQALIGKKVGDQVEIEVPVGKLRYEILRIEYRT